MSQLNDWGECLHHIYRVAFERTAVVIEHIVVVRHTIEGLELYSQRMNSQAIWNTGVNLRVLMTTMRFLLDYDYACTVC